MQAMAQRNEVIQFHGSGSTVGSRCIWHILETMGEQTKVPMRATYRSTGSGTGEEEFMGNITYSYNDFGSSDYPLPKEQFELLQDAGQEMIHLPVIMGAMAVFHSVPMNSASDLNLTSCLVARIYQGEITDWTHPDIVAINPTMNLTVQYDFYGKPKQDQSLPINVVHRADPSGSTHTFVSYLHKACPEHWGPELVDAAIEWPMAGSDFLYSVQGTSELIPTIQQVLGTIGYADAGAALDKGLDEVALKIEHDTLKEDFYLTSRNALSKDGIAAALENEGSKIPDRGDADWSGVDLINQVGVRVIVSILSHLGLRSSLTPVSFFFICLQGYIYAWPIVAITYVYVRKDLSFMSDPRAQSLMVAFFKALYDPVFTKKCEEEYLFLPVPESIRNIALSGIELLELDPSAPEWIQETDILSGVGQGDNVISIRRKSSSTIHLDLLTDKVRNAEMVLGDVLTGIDSIQTTADELRDQINRVVRGEFDEANAQLFNELDQRLDATFIMSITSLILGVITFLFMIVQQSRLGKVESNPPLKLASKARKPSVTSSTQE